jgi:hypothetical protein
MTPNEKTDLIEAAFAIVLACLIMAIILGALVIFY